ncbi:MAG TPA: hypothetical protein VD735_05775 [Candidatus Saccharimonadales bacterium]|nr:hypothetical protein [Candidatus Saccharimonadales bacterium]
MSETKSRLSFITSRPYWWVYAIGTVILIASAWTWWTKVHLAPNNVFWGMMENSLQTKGVTIETNQQSQGRSAKQLVQFELGATNRAYSFSTINQGATRVQTEIIGTRDADYSRYRSIQTDEKNADGKKLDTSKILGVWAKSDDVQQSATQQSGNQLFAQAVIGTGLPLGGVPVPLGDLTPKQRTKMLDQIREQGVYDTSFKDVVKRREDGRLLYTYRTKIQSILYVQLMKNFAKDLGFSELAAVDPNTYQNSEPIQVDLTVDAKTRRLVAVLNNQSGAKQEYRAYGLPLDVQIPQKTISSAELQKRLSEL